MGNSFFVVKLSALILYYEKNLHVIESVERYIYIPKKDKIVKA